MIENEETLLRMFCAAHLDCDGEIEIKSTRYAKSHDVYVARYINPVEKGGELKGSWETVQDAVSDALRLARKGTDDIIFYATNYDVGTTWRMLKLDMAFLRIVLRGDRDALKAIIKRLASLVQKSMESEEESKAHLN